MFDPAQGRPVIDGVAGARSDLAPAPSVDIANGAPTGADATTGSCMTYVSGDAQPRARVLHRVHATAAPPGRRRVPIETAGDRGFYAAPAISPNGTNVYVVYNAFTTPFRTTTADPRALVGVVLHAHRSTRWRPTGAFTELHRGAPATHAAAARTR